MSDEDGDLASGLTKLSQLLTGTGDLDDTLTRVAEFAAEAIPNADGVGLTLLRDNRRQTVVADADFVREVDEVQYRIDEGPCITAVIEQETVLSSSLGGDARWPRFGPRVGRMGVHSALSLPLLVGDRIIGVLNVYARAKDAFGSKAARLGELFAQPAAVSVYNAQVLTDLHQTVEQLNQALTSRATIDQAIGLLMSRTGSSAEEAFERLRQISRRDGVRVAVVAKQLLDEAVGRARARHADR